MSDTRWARLLVLLLLAGVAPGCAEYAVFRSSPSSARVYVNDEFVGLTPATLTIPRSAMGKTFYYRIEHEQCLPTAGELRKWVAPGRIVGYVFSAGIVAIFKGPRYPRPVDAVLEGPKCPGGAYSGPRPRERQVSPEDHRNWILDRLHTLDQLRDEGAITEDEYKTMREGILGEL
jgi:hypothetical protein